MLFENASLKSLFYVKMTSVGVDNKRKRKITVLDKSEMYIVIEVWKENVEALRSTSKNSHIYKKMCEELKAYGLALSPEELKNRLNNLTRKYRYI